MLRERTIDDDPFAIALRALVWILAKETRSVRFLDLTGIDPQTLRANIGEAATLDAVLGYLEAHQPDLIACAEETCISPERLVAARGRLA